MPNIYVKLFPLNFKVKFTVSDFFFVNWNFLNMQANNSLRIGLRKRKKRVRKKKLSRAIGASVKFHSSRYPLVFGPGLKPMPPHTLGACAVPGSSYTLLIPSLSYFGKQGVNFEPHCHCLAHARWQEVASSIS